jgi:hypothetical protein
MRGSIVLETNTQYPDTIFSSSPDIPNSIVYTPQENSGDNGKLSASTVNCLLCALAFNNDTLSSSIYIFWHTANISKLKISMDVENKNSQNKKADHDSR